MQPHLTADTALILQFWTIRMQGADFCKLDTPGRRWGGGVEKDKKSPTDLVNHPQCKRWTTKQHIE